MDDLPWRAEQFPKETAAEIGRIGKAEPRSEVVFVGFGLPEFKYAGEACNGIKRLQVGIPRIGCEFISESKVERKVFGDLHIILEEPVQGLLVAGKKSGSRSAQGSIVSIGDQVVDELAHGRVIPLAAASRKEISGRDDVAIFNAALDLMASDNIAQVVECLVVVLNGALRRIFFGPDIQAKLIDFDGWEVGKVRRNPVDPRTLRE